VHPPADLLHVALLDRASQRVSLLRLGGYVDGAVNVGGGQPKRRAKQDKPKLPP
jgi:hypothetical protein